MSAEETEPKPRTYGNWMKPEEKGILPGLGPLGTGIIFMEKLWSASNVISYLGGIREPDFLDHLSKLLGEYDYRTRQVSFRRSDVDSNVSVNRDTILSLDELAALPRGRELLLASGSRPVLARTEPWMARPDAGLVRRSIGEAERRRAHA